MEGLGAGTACIDTLLHIAKLFARSRTLDTNFFAFLADMLGVLRLQEHEMRGRTANFCTGHHQTKMGRFDMPPADFKAMTHGTPKACLIAAQAPFDAEFHPSIHLLHFTLLTVLNRPVSATIGLHL